MYRFRWLAVAAALAALTPIIATAQSAGGYGDYIDWAGWARVAPLEQAGLASSYDPSGGIVDYNHYEYPPGLIMTDLDVTAATIMGPGIIYRFWMPHRTATQPFEIRMYFDGETTPRIDTNSGQVLGGTYSYFSAPLVTTFAGGQVCYEPIAFRESIRIDTENRAGLQHYYQYTYRTFPPGTDLDSWDGTPDAEAWAARSATIAMFQNVGDHPAGESGSAVRDEVGPTSIPAGGTLTLADLTGPGLIRRLNVRMDGATDGELDNLTLRVFWDGAALPAIDVPVGWFFGAGHDRTPYRSLPMGTDSPEGFYCYWPMPFGLSARIELSNPTASSIAIDSAIVEHESWSVDASMGYLHAVAREATRAPGSTRYTMAEISGTGHYVGNFLFLEQDYDDDFMLEGDDILLVDGVRTIAGTGLEDIYNGGYYYNWVANPMPEPEGPSPPFAIRPLNGLLRKERSISPPFRRADQYRWMIADRVSFTQSLKVDVENLYAQVGSRWKSVVFWYQLPIPATDAPSPTNAGDRARGFGILSITPNPAVGAAAIRFALPVGGHASLDLLDVAGRKIGVLSDGARTAGVHEVRWSRGGHPNGVYIIRLQVGDLTESRKLILIR